MSYKVYRGDIFTWAQSYTGPLFHAVLCDPPYELGFMGKKWDSSGVAFRAETWAAIGDCLLPGAFMLAFGGTRTWHRLACAIEDAGFEIRDTIMWVYGSGFPKSHNVSKAIDGVLGKQALGFNTAGGKDKFKAQELSYRSDYGYKFVPTSELAVTWQGYGTALKPAQETVIIARKPTQPITEHGIIVANLYKLEAQLWLLSNVSIVGKNLECNQSEYDAALSIARWSAEEVTNIREGLFGQMDTQRFAWVTTSILNTVSLWRNTWEEALSVWNTFITETVTSPIIDLRTLSCSVLALTPQDIIQAEITQPGSWWNVLPAARVLNAAAMKLSATLELFAVESAIEKGRIPPPDAVDQEILSRPIIVARKPLSGTVAENCVEYGAGALWIDGARVGGIGRTSGGTNTGARVTNFGHKPGNDRPTGGRWPANFIHDGSDEVVGEFPKSGSGSGIVKKARPGAQPFNVTRGWNSHSMTREGATAPEDYGDEGSAARFFYCAKASKRERDAGCEGMEEVEATEMTGRQPDTAGLLRVREDGSIGENPYAGKSGQARNHHPTVKPIALTEYLAKLILPPAEYAPRRILVPFSGSGSEMIGAHRAGWDEITGVELDAEYCQIAEARLAHWVEIPVQMELVK